MKIEVWSDFVCPFCYVGKRRLEESLDTFKHDVEIEYKSFELDPEADVEMNMNVYELLSKKYGTSIEQAKNMSKGVMEQGAQAGIQFNFDDSIPTNTFDAHRLAKFAASKGLEASMAESLFKAHFIEGRHIGDKETLLSISESIGLDLVEVKEILSGSHFSKDVRFDESEARQLGVQGVPFFVINRKYAISGAQPAEVFESTLQKVWEEENSHSPLQTLAGESGMQCDDNGCQVPNDKK